MKKKKKKKKKKRKMKNHDLIKLKTTHKSVESQAEKESRSGKTNSRSKQNSRLASKNFIKKGRNELARVKHT